MGLTALRKSVRLAAFCFWKIPLELQAVLRSKCSTVATVTVFNTVTVFHHFDLASGFQLGDALLDNVMTVNETIVSEAEQCMQMLFSFLS